MQSQTRTGAPVEESEELKRFREDWKAELRKQGKLPVQSAAANDTSATDNQSTTVTGPSGTSTHTEDDSVKSAPSDAGNAPGSSGISFDGPSCTATGSVPSRTTYGVNSHPLTSGQKKALSYYREALAHEQRGEYNDAISLYRLAFKLEDKIDKIYNKLELEHQLTTGRRTSNAASRQPGSSSKAGAVEHISHELASLDLNASAPLSHGPSGTLAKVVESFPDHLSFLPEDEKMPVPIERLPNELLIGILCKLDYTIVERFGAVSRKARRLTLDPAIWRGYVQKIYKPPQIPAGDGVLFKLLEHYMYDYRQLYIEHPRIRLDGVYIAICQYVRPGLTENAWVSQTHLITYHRYLRFYPNGEVLSLLANEEQGPSTVVHMLKPTLRMKGLFIGTWSLDGNTLHITNLFDASGQYELPDSFSTPHSPTLPAATITHGSHGHGHTHSSSSGAAPALTAPKYTFQMTLQLRSRPLGRWNRLEIVEYGSVNTDGEVGLLPLKHERPFWFSKVKSWA